jgi:hypothetical protein
VTKFNTDYEYLVALGLPRLDKGYSYKFFIKDFTKYKEGYTTLVEKKMKNALRVRIYKHILGIPFYVWGWAEDVDEMRSFYSQLNDRVISRGLASEDEVHQRKWLPGHLVIAGQDCFNDWQLDVEKERVRKEKKKALKKNKHTDAEFIAHLLNNRMP